MIPLLLIAFLANPIEDLRETLRALESPVSAERVAAERRLSGSPDLVREEAALDQAVESGGPETRLRMARVLGARPDAFPLLVRWLAKQTSGAGVAREALGDLYKSFRGGKSEKPSKSGDLEEAPEDSFRRAWARIPSDGLALQKLVEILHRREALDRPLLLDPQLPWDGWIVPGSHEGRPWEGFLGALFSQVLAKPPATFPGKPALRAYGTFLWLSNDPAAVSEEAIFLRICASLHATSEADRRLAALDLGRLGFGPAERLFADSLRDDALPWLEWSGGLFSGQGVSPWLRERSTIERVIAKLPRLSGIREEIVRTLAQLGRRDAAGVELETLYALELERAKDESSRSALARLLGMLGSKRAIPALRELARPTEPETLALLIALLSPEQAESAALEILEKGTPSASALRAAAGAIRSEGGSKRFGQLMAKSLKSLREDGREAPALEAALTMREIQRALPQEAAPRRAWQESAIASDFGAHDRDLIALCLLSGFDFPGARDLRNGLLEELRKGKMRWLEIAARAVGRSTDPSMHQGLAALTLCENCPEPLRLAAIAGLEEAISLLVGPDREKELTALQSTMAPLRAGPERIASRFEEWVQRSLRPFFDGENLLREW